MGQRTRIVFVLRQPGKGTPVREVCRKAKLSEANFSNRRKHYGEPTDEISGRRLRTCLIRRLVKRTEQNAGIPEPIAERLFGHSMRVGVAKDMIVNGFSTLAIMQAGGWKKPDVVFRYVENNETRSPHHGRWAALTHKTSASSRTAALAW
ncbi:tyrosine-type recombinase/integrase [Thermohalobaculum sediminis]|uniref:tyrosine-type recombinase/integrase n=1 Tax=Thermohalobaculum sediminis TaxID=2939436 RepID=UPI0038739262